MCLYDIVGHRFHVERILFHCVAGGDELEELQPWRRLPVRPWKNDCAVERTKEQQTGKAQSKGTVGLCITDLNIQLKQKSHS